MYVGLRRMTQSKFWVSVNSEHLDKYVASVYINVLTFTRILSSLLIKQKMSDSDIVHKLFFREEIQLLLTFLQILTY